MGSFDSATWQALGLVLTILGLAISFVLWRRRGAVSGIRAVAWSLLPLAAGLTGTLRLLWEIGDSVVSWATRLVFSPVVWIGVVVAGTSAVLFGLSSAMRRRGVGAGSRGDEPKPLTSRASRPAAKAPKSSTSQPAGDDGMDDIDAILKKHGIS